MDKKGFVNIFNSVTGKHNLQELWSDWIQMLALEINTVVEPKEERIKYLNSIRGKYSESEITKLAEVTAAYIEIIEENPFQDMLGQLYMELDFGSDVTGQFFTPYHLSQLCANLEIQKLSDTIESDGWGSAYDPTCGGGAMLIAAGEKIHRILEKDGKNFQNHVLFVGQELNSTTAMMCYIQLSFLGVAGVVIVGDTLTRPYTGSLLNAAGENVYLTPVYNSDVWRMRAIVNGVRKCSNERKREVGADRQADDQAV